MKNRLLLILFGLLSSAALHAQKADTAFTARWREADSLVDKQSLPKSALEKVKHIYNMAVQQHNEGQAVKALIYTINLQSLTSDQHVDSLVIKIKKQLQSPFSTAHKSMLQVVLAKLYTAYYNAYQWEIRGRSKTTGITKPDIATWNNQDFYTAITGLYDAALAPAVTLLQTSVTKYAPAMEEDINSGKWRPSLYDFIANTAIDFLNTTGRQLAVLPTSTPGKIALAPFNELLAWQPAPGDSSNNTRILRLYRQLLQQHSADSNPAAFIDADINRIRWARQETNLADKDSLYAHALQHITNIYGSNPAASNAWYLQALLLSDASYTPLTDTANRYSKLKALAIIQQHGNPADSLNQGYRLMRKLQQYIEDKQVNIQVEQANSPGIPFRVLVSYKNAPVLYSKVISVGFEATNGENLYNSDEIWKKAAAAKAVLTSTQPLPVTGDYQQHSTEIKIDALTPGKYLLIVSSGAAFNVTDAMAAQYLVVSGLAYTKHRQDYFVLNRETGAPVKNVIVQLQKIKWNNEGKKVYNKIGELATDANGYFNPGKVLKEGNDFIVRLVNGNDTLYPSGSEYIPYTNRSQTNESSATNLSFFTDRSIYRPGQTVYFKGIALHDKWFNKRNETTLQLHDSVCVQLRDVNSRIIDSVKLETNEYGSIAGKFTLPQTGNLNGNYSLGVKKGNGYMSFRVEEYKRPTFYIDFDTLRNSYRLNDSVVVTGQLKSYAGVALRNTAVQLTVNRMVHYPYTWLFYNRIWPSAQAEQVSFETVNTDEAGRFTLRFIAAPASNALPQNNPVFDFDIAATATDNSGETRTNTTRLSVSYKPVLLQWRLPETSTIDSFKTVKIATTNLAGIPVTATVHITISPLQHPERLTRTRYWEQPDQFVMDSIAYVKLFPYDAYKNENDFRNWPQQQLVISETLATGANTLSISRKLLPGIYVAAVSAIVQGDTVTDKQYIQLYNNQSLPVMAYNWQYNGDQHITPGKTAKLTVGSAAKDVHLISYSIDERDSAIYQFKKVSEAITTIEAPVTASTGIFYTFVKHNRFYTGGSSYQLQDEDRAIDVTYSSFRDKTMPGSAEQWTIHTSRQGGKTNAAELLTGMYDASLDQFIKHDWAIPGLRNSRTFYAEWNNSADFDAQEGIRKGGIAINEDLSGDQYDKLLPIELQSERPPIRLRGAHVVMKKVAPGIVSDDAVFGNVATLSYSTSIEKPAAAAPPAPQQEREEAQATAAPAAQSLRTNFNETAFFFPQLLADSAGNYNISFTMPDAVTQWKWMSLAHTKDLAFAYTEKLVTSQKTLMVQPNLPRFVRNGDQLEFSARISNLSDQELSGQAGIQLIDPVTNQPVDGLFQNVFPMQYFTVAANGTASVKFPVSIPFNYNQPVTVRITATAGKYSDGEEHALAVLSNRSLVTESMPILVMGDGSKNISFSKLLHNESETLTQQGITVEFSSNPLWYAIQALPYLMEFPHECAEQTFNRLYANLLATQIVQQHPVIKTLFEQWQKDSTALRSNLQNNTELKQLVLQETPWVADAENEATQRKNLAQLFDLVKMQDNTTSALNKLKDLQLSTGYFPWFKNGPDDRYITIYILNGISRLKNLHVLTPAIEASLNNIAAQALLNLDAAVLRDYKASLKYSKQPGAGSPQLQYLFMRSSFTNILLANKTAFNYYYTQAKKQWAGESNYNKALIGLTCLLNNDQVLTEKSILPSVLENAVADSTRGMYWKDRQTSFWYASPIEHQSLMLLLAEEMNKRKPSGKLASAISDMQTWLLLNKQANNWKTTIATADACYVLLNDQPKLDAVPLVNITLGDTHFSNDNGEQYLKQNIPAQKVNSNMGNITVQVKGNAGKPSWGAVYWQYFEDYNKVTGAGGPLSVNRRLFVQKTTATGPVLTPVNEGDELKTGDKVVIRLEIRSDRDLDYVHLKDTRSATMEPVNVLSEYKWQDGLGYYETTHDASTDFFFSQLNKGTHVFEYPAFITHTGSFTAGMATIQCMYAPEFNAHSDGIKISVQ
ncbi:alpha-2-macroglobulin family protein [Deminuibacter soli]|nr:alpha-2-macroglobulin family protein [Deminuibacter soli]